MRRIFRIFFISISILLVAMWVFAPFGKSIVDGKKSIEHTLEIDAPVDSVFRFLGRSSSATQWSVFVHHISTLNAAEHADGTVGCKRRCFCNENEQGRRWDETIVEVVKDSLRALTIENLVEFPLGAENLRTEQVYKSIGPNRTQLTLRLFYIDNAYSFWDGLKTRAGSFTIHSVFRKNLENIKSIIEGRSRIHPFDPAD